MNEVANTYTASEIMNVVVLTSVIFGFAIYGLLVFIDKFFDSTLGHIFDFWLKRYIAKLHAPVKKANPLDVGEVIKEEHDV